MLSAKTRTLTSIVLKLCLIVSTTVGLYLCFLSTGFMGGSTLFLYFTVQSNIWIAAVDLVLVIMQIRAIQGRTYALPKRAYLAQQVFTVAITLTGIVYCFVLLPVFLAMQDGAGFNPFDLSQMLVHVVTPVLAVVDLIGFTRNSDFKKIDCLWAVLPPLYYLFFSMAGYFLGWDFGGGNNFPYFFLNYGSPVGLFGYGGEMPYFMGSFYWIMGIVIFVLGISLAYIAIVNKLIKRMPKGI